MATFSKMKVVWNGKDIGNRIEIDVGRVERSVAEKVVDDARKLCPTDDRTGSRKPKSSFSKSWMERRPGALRNSIKVSKGKWGGYLVTVGGGDEFYATFIELGAPAVPITIGYKTAPIDGRPFMRPAAWTNRSTFTRGIKQAFNRLGGYR